MIAVSALLNVSTVQATPSAPGPSVAQTTTITQAVKPVVETTTVAEAIPDPLTCAGYPEPRIFLEIQGWWQDAATGEAFPGRHVHAGLCWPTGVVSTSTFSASLRIILHKQPAGAYITRGRISDYGNNNSSHGDPWVKTSGFNSIDSSGNLTQWVPLSFSVSSLISGGHEMRLAVVIHQPSGAQQFVSSGLPFYARRLETFTRSYTEARGWYTKFNYINGRFHSGLASLLNRVPAIWHPVVECARPSGTTAITTASAHVDPSFHDGIVGTVYRFALSGKQTLSIVTTGLTAGVHRLVIVCGAKANFGGSSNGTDTGVLNLPFIVGG